MIEFSAMLAGMFILFLMGTPIAFAMLIAGLGWIIFGHIPGSNLNIMATKTVHALNSFPLLAIPFFMLAGNIMNASKVTDRVFEFANTLVAHRRGGLAQVNILASMIFAGMSGSGVADAAGLGKVEVKAMTDAGYDGPFTTAVTASSAAIGPIIPPSIPFVLFGAITYISVGKLLLGGLIPGVLMGIVLMTMVWYLAKRRGYQKGKKAPFSYIWRTFQQTFWALLTPVVLLGGILSGVFTPTEAAAVAALYAIVVGLFVYRSITLGKLYRTFVETATFCAKILFVVAAAGIVGRLFALAQIPAFFAGYIAQTFQSPTTILLVLATFCFFMGCILDDLSLLLILTPIFTPIILQAGVEPVHWGVIMVMVLNLGMITPPMGTVMFVTRTWTNISLKEYATSIAWFSIPLFLEIVFLIFFPWLVLVLPNLITK